MRCPLCGFRFEKEAAACPSCPLHRQCKLIRCPNCSYCQVEESRLADLLRRLLKGAEGEGRRVNDKRDDDQETAPGQG